MELTMRIKPNPEIAVIGAGAIGSLVGGLLAHHAHRVVLIGRHDHVTAINRNRLHIDGVAGTFDVNIRAVEALNFHPDLTLVTVKNQDVEAACRTIKPYMGAGPVVMMQNGVTGTETAAAVFGCDPIIGCTLLLNARFLSPGCVSFANQAPIVIGRAFGPNDEAVAQLRLLLGQVAATTISSDIRGVQWTKLLINAVSNSLDGMTGLNFNTCLQYPEMRRIAVLILKEAIGLMNRAHIRPAPIPGLPSAFFRFMPRLPTPIAMQLFKLAAKAKTSGEIKTSTLQSLLKGKATEIDYLNGEFVRLGQRLGMPAPVNAKVVELIHTIERCGKFYAPSELMAEFGLRE